MQTIRRFILLLAMIFTVPVVYAQNIIWLQGTWRGKAYLPGSDGSQYYLLIMKISEIRGNRFEGIIATMQPTDTSYRFDSRISGVVYDKYLIINRTRVLYVKDAPDIKWKVSCNNCKPPRMVLSVEQGKIFFRGEVKDCYRECNGISEFSKDIKDFDSSKKEAMYAMVHYISPTEADRSSLARNPSASSSSAIAPESGENSMERRAPVTTPGEVASNLSANKPQNTSSPNQGTLPQLNTSVTMKKNPSPRVSILPSGEIIKTEGKRTIQFAQGESISLHRNLYLALRENPSPRLSVLPSGAIVSTQAHNIKALPSKGIRSLDRNVYLALRENPSPRLSILPSGGIVSTKANNIKVVSTMEIISPNKNIHVVLRENPSPRIAILPEGDIVFGKTNDIKALPQQEIVPLHKNVSLPILQNPAPRLALLPPGEIVSTRHSNAGQISRSLQERISLMIKESPPQRITILSAGDIVTAKRQTTSSLNKKITNASGHAPSLTVEQNKSTTVTKSPSPDSLSLTIKAGDTTAKKLVVFHRDSIALPEDYAERKKNVIRTLSVNTDSVILRVYDNGIVDGDIVSVIYNDNVVIDKLSLTSRAVVVKIPVDRSQVNTLVFHAHNLGSYPPNTAKLEILYGNKKEELTVSSDLTVSSTIDLVHQ